MVANVLPNAEAGDKIVIRHATKLYDTGTGKVHAVEDFSANIKEGSIVCLVGPSGCGKSTLLWSIAGLHPLTSGEILLNDRPVRGPRPEIGMVFQQPVLLPWKTIMGNIHFPLQIKGIGPRSVQSRIDHLLEVAGLAGFANKYPRELSGGMQQRASMVRCLSFDPEILLMDEPFGALDAFTREEMNLLLLRIWQETKKTIIFVTHNIQEAIFLGHEVYCMTPRPGRLARVFPVDFPYPRSLDIMADPKFISLYAEIKHTLHG